MRSDDKPFELELAMTDQVFILRFWKEEAGADRKPQWRVQVQNVNTRRRQIVDDVDRAFAIVVALLNAASDDDAGEASNA